MTTSLAITAWGETIEVTPEFSTYSNDRLAISFDCAEGPYAKLTVNLPKDSLDIGEVFIKDWSENEYLVEALVDAGWIKFTGRKVPVFDWADAKVAHLAGPLLQAYQFSNIEAHNI